MDGMFYEDLNGWRTDLNDYNKQRKTRGY